MDIRIINGDGNIMNISRMHLEARDKYLIALTEDVNQEVLIETCRNEEEAEQFLNWIKEAIKTALEEESDNVLIDLEEKEQEEATYVKMKVSDIQKAIEDDVTGSTLLRILKENLISKDFNTEKY